MSKTFMLVPEQEYRNLLLKPTNDPVNYTEKRMQAVLEDPKKSDTEKNLIFNQLLSTFLKQKRAADEKPIPVEIVDKRGNEQKGVVVDDKLQTFGDFSTTSEKIPEITQSTESFNSTSSSASIDDYDTVLSLIEANRSKYGITTDDKLLKNFKSKDTYKGSNLYDMLDFIYNRREFRRAPSGAKILEGRIKKSNQTGGSRRKKQPKIIKFRPIYWK